MSTKTTFKRIALVAVAALGFGMISNVPANAAAIAPTSIVVGTIPTAQVGVANIVPVTITLPLTATTADTFTLSARVTSAPTGSGYRSIPGTVAHLQSGISTPGTTVKAAIDIQKPTTNTGALTAAIGMASGLSVGANFSPSVAQVAAAAVAGVFTVTLNVSVMPDIAGSYTVLVSTNGDDNSTVDTDSDYVAGDANTTYSFATGGSVSTVTLAAVTGSGIAGATQGVLMSATIKDAAGAVAQLGVNETITFSSPSTTETLVGIRPATTSAGVGGSDIGSASGSYVATSANFLNGVAYFRYYNSAAETAVVTATGSGLLPATVVGTLSITTRTASTVAASGVITDSTAQAAAITAGTGGRTAVSGTYAQSVATTATSHSYTVTLGTAATLAGDYISAVVTDTSGRITGIVGGTYAVALTTAAVGTATTGGTAPLSITATLATAGNSFAVTVAGATLTVTSAAAAVTTLSAISPSATTIRQADGASTAMTVRVLDQFGAAMASQVVTVATTGRNASTTATTVVSDASGYVSFTRADAGTAATVLKADTVTFTFTPTTGSAVTRAYTVNYGSTAVGTITCTSGAELDTATSVTYRDISSADGAEAGAASLCTVTIKDANGAIMVGVPVTVTTASAGAAVLSTSATLYTGAAGTVAPSVYAWTAGAKTFTVTAGTVTSTETINFRQNDAAEVRSIAVRADGNRHYVTASDRFGNPVPGVRIYGSRTGSGLFGGGSPTANGITGSPAVVDANTGVAEFIFNGGSTESVVTYQVASAADTPSATFGATDALKGLTDGTTATSTFTATVAGTALLAEVGVGASFDAAGVNSVKATIAPDTAAADAVSAAADAAAEATDAANAATDAANAAAEAADAATAAAQDAADAVAALSTQVSEMVDALKKQITALTNLVIKIQKKVRA
jgi:trimeric autotransporter adhesin